MRLGQQNRRPCPYFFCSAILTVYVTKRYFEDPDDKMIEMIPTHEIRNDSLPPETCPASLMSFPLDDEMERLLHGMERTHYNQLLEKARRENSEPPRMPFLEPPPSGSQSMLPKPGSHRFGRTPATEEDQQDWQLGGRQGFEVSGTPEPGQPIPSTTGGHAFTGRSENMSVAGVRALIVASAVEANGAIGAIDEAKDPYLLTSLAQLREGMNHLVASRGALESASTTLFAASEEGSPDLDSYAAIYRNLGEEDLAQVHGVLAEAEEKILAAIGQLEEIKPRIAGNIEEAASYGDRL